MRYKNSIEFKVYGKTALFSDPLTRVGGEKFSYPVPTYQALKGVVESIYWKPTFIWYIDAVRIMEPIRMQAKGIRPISYSKAGNSLSIYTYLSDVEYRVRAHFEWNENRPELESDRNENKHYFIAKRMVEKGGRRDIFLGTRECQSYVEECGFDDGKGAYDDVSELAFGLMFHGFNYPDELKDALNQTVDKSESSAETKGKGKKEEKSISKPKLYDFSVRFWQPVLKHGIIEFIRPDECEIIRNISPKQIKTFSQDVNFINCDPLYEELGGGIL